MGSPNNCPKSKKPILVGIISVLMLLVLSASFSSQAFANSETMNFQGKIVRNDAGNEGLNITAGTPACVIAGVNNDTCDFKVTYYNAATLGVAYANEVFSNVEIGEYNGLFNLKLGAGTFTAGTETSFRNIFLKNSNVYYEVQFAPAGAASFTETFLESNGDRMAARAAAYALSSSGATDQFQFDVQNTEAGYSNIGEGQVFYDGDDDVLRVYNGTAWLEIQASSGGALWQLNTGTTPDTLYSNSTYDVAIGGTDSTSPFFLDVSGELLTLTNTTAGNSFVVNDATSDASPFVIDAAGKVGIGDSTPEYMLDAHGATTTVQGIAYTDTETSTGVFVGEAYGVMGLFGVGSPASVYLSSRNANSSNSGYVRVGSAADWGVDLIGGGYNTGGNIGLHTWDGTVGNGSFTERLTVEHTTGYVGIGTTTPGSKLEVKGTGGSTSGLLLANTNETVNSFFSSDALDSPFYITYTGNGGSDIILTHDGDMGLGLGGSVGIGEIGTTSSRLQIAASDALNSQIHLVTGVNPTTPVDGDLWYNGSNLYFYDGSTSVDILVGSGGGGDSLFTDGGAVTYLTSLTDDFAIGGTDSTAPFFFDEGAEILSLTNTTAGNSFVVNDEASDASPFVIDANGNVGIGTATPGAKLDIGGASSTISNSSGDITINSASNNISLSGDNITNAGGAAFAGDVTISGSQFQLGNIASNPTAVGEGAMYYNTTDDLIYYNTGAGWQEVGAKIDGTTNQTARYDGADWVGSSVLTNDGTNLATTGQFQFGNFGTKPAGMGQGAVVWDTALGGLFVFDGTDWNALSTSTMSSTNGVVADGSYLELVHNQDTFDVIASAWVKVGSQWVETKDISNSITHDSASDFNPEHKKKVKVDTIKNDAAGNNNFGDGSDGAITIASSTDINVTDTIGSRVCPEGGDAVSYTVNSLTTNTATLATSPSAGCLDNVGIGDEILLINLKGSTTVYTNLGNYETLRVASISSNVVTFTSNKIEYYGDGVSDDTNIGTGSTNQRVMLQRVPNYTNVTIDSGQTFYPTDWNEIKGGVMAFRATGTVSIAGSLSVVGTGYVGGAKSNQYNTVAYGGVGFCGTGGTGGKYNGIVPIAGGCGGGGGGTAYNGTNRNGAAGSSTGGAGGGGGSSYGSTNGYGGGGGGGGYGTAGEGGQGYYGYDYDGGNNVSGAGGNSASSGSTTSWSGGGGGGGTYGDSSDLSQMFFGNGGGGGGGGYSGGALRSGGIGGNGGGILWISADTISVTGALTTSGDAGAAGVSAGGAGGGGGAGGSMKLAANTLNMGTGTTVDGGARGDYGAGGYYGGKGGAGVLAIYQGSGSQSGTPVITPSFNGDLEYFAYSVFVSEEIETPGASALGDISWTESVSAGNDIYMQTRSGATSDSTDDTWEEWKPWVGGTNYTSLEAADTHTNWIGTNMTVAEGDVDRNVDYFEDSDEATVTNLTKGTAIAANGYMEATIGSTNISSDNILTFWVRSSISGNSMRVGFGETTGNDQFEDIYIDDEDVWQKVYWDISDVTGTSRDAITKLRVTSTQDSAVIYIDNLLVETLPTTAAGQAMASTADDYIQYRVVMTATDTTTTPIISDVRIGYTNPSGTYTIDADSIRRINSLEYQDSIRTSVLEEDLDEIKSGRVLKGDDYISIKNGFSLGTGADGDVTISGSANINTLDSISGRSCFEGGDAVNYSVSSLGTASASVVGNPSVGCIDPGDEVLIINQKGSTSVSTNLGNYETLRVAEVSGNVVKFTTDKTKYYGDGVSDDTNIGTGSTNQRVMLQRVPNYANLTVETSQSLYPTDWDGTKGGVLALRATGTVNIAGTLSVVGTGYAGGAKSNQYNTTAYGGEAYCGLGGNGGHYSGVVPSSGNCGGGGGGTAYNGTIRNGAAGSSTGGAGGGGGSSYGTTNGYGGGGGGGGYGTAGEGGQGYSGYLYDGGNNVSGTGGPAGSSGTATNWSGGGGGGGTYGDSPDLSQMFFGNGGGGGGGGYSGAVTRSGGIGGNGGGILWISADTISVTGALTAKGDAGAAGISLGGAGGGGGAGGSMKLAANTLNMGTGTTADGGARGDYGTGGYYGGKGGAGVLAIYQGSGTQSGTPIPTPYDSSVENLSYAAFISDEIATLGSSDLGKLFWNPDINKYGDIQIETRTGATSNSTDGTWEAWKPWVNGTNYLSLETTDTHTNWTGTNVTVAEGDINRDINYYEDDDEATVTNLTKLSSTTNGGYSEATISAADLSSYEYVTFWVYAEQAGSTVQIGIGEAAATEEIELVTIDDSRTWQKVYWDVSDISPDKRDAITKLRITNVGTDSVSNLMYIDSFNAERHMRNDRGSVINSTANEYIQYKVVLTTTNNAYRPSLYEVTFSWNNGYKIDLVDSNTARLYNYSGVQQELRLNVTAAGGSGGGGSNWTAAGGNVYRSSGYVGIGDATPDVELKVVGALCVKSDDSNCAGSAAGTIYANTTSVQSADLAEEYEVSDLSINEGDLVSLTDIDGEVEKATRANGEKLIGAISTQPGLLMNDTQSDTAKPVGLVGRVPVKVMRVKEDIIRGAGLAVSQVDGIASISKDPGYILGRAIQDTLNWSTEKCTAVDSLEEIVWNTPDGLNKDKECFRVPLDSFPLEQRESIADEHNVSENIEVYIGKIMVYVNVTWAQPSWFTSDLTQLVQDYKAGIIGAGAAFWEQTGTNLITTNDVFANSFSSNYGMFNILSGGLLSVADDKFMVDSGGNLNTAGDIVLAGRLKGENGDLIIELGDSSGANIFAIENSNGETVFSVDSKGEVGGKGTYKSGWLKVAKNNSITVEHKFGKTPSSVDIQMSKSSSGANFTTKGLGRDFYYESIDDDNLKIVNTLDQDIYVKLTIAR